MLDMDKDNLFKLSKTDKLAKSTMINLWNLIPINNLLCNSLMKKIKNTRGPTKPHVVLTTITR